MDVFKLAAKITLDSKDYEEKLKDAEQQGETTSRKIGGGLKTAAGLAVKGIAAVGTGVATLAGLSVKGYSDLEQLAGGVDTLFKNSADTVKNYAENAYKTAGMNANEYMETITGFSASLINALSGDTAAAAEVGNMAVVAMSDNVNKMGTSMESVQYAFQGFAKGNYTMLDNLKLGYGGSQAEMQRLIADASKMSEEQEKLGVTVDGTSMSFDNVINAIAVMQEHLGIAGATAAEAAGTIEGSFKMAKSSFEDMITGLANPEADMGKLVDNFATSAVAAFKNVIPAIGRALEGIGQLIPAMGKALIDAAPQLRETAAPVMKNLFDGIVNNIPLVIQAAPKIIGDFVTYLLNNLPAIINAGLRLVQALVQGVVGAIPSIVAQGARIVASFARAILSAPQLLSNAGLAIVNGVINGAKSALKSVASVGRDIVKGVWNGIKGAGGWIKGKVSGFFGDIVKAAKSKLKIASPSKVFRDEVGYFISLGVAAGIDKGKSKAIAAADKLARSVYEKSKTYADKTIKEQKYSLSEQLELWTTIQGQFIESSKEYADAEKEISDIRVKLMDENEKLQEAYDKKFEERSNKIFNSFKLFDEVKKPEETVSGWDLVNNLRDQISAIDSFYTNLNELKERTGNVSLVEQIKEMGVGAAAQLQALLDLSDEKLTEYSGLFKDKQALANKLAGEELSGLYEETQTKITENNNALKGIFDEDAPKIGKALPDGMKAGIIAGKSGVINAAISVARAAVEAAKDELGVASPSKVFKKIGGFMSEGLSIGFTDKISRVRSTIEDGLHSISKLGNIQPLAIAGGAGGGNSYSYGGISIHIEHMDGDERSIETLATELEFLRRQQDDSKGGKK